MRADKHGGSNFPGIQKRWRKKNKAPHRFFAPKAPIQNAAPFVGGRLFPASLGSSRRYPANSSVTHFPLRAWSRPWAAKIGRKQPPFLFADGNAEVGFHSTCSTHRRAQRLFPLGTSPLSGREGSWTTTEHAVFQALVPPGFRQCGQDVSFSDRRRALPCEIRSLVTDIDRVAERTGTINVLPDFSPHRAGVSPKPARSTDTRRHRPLRK